MTDNETVTITCWLCEGKGYMQVYIEDTEKMHNQSCAACKNGIRRIPRNELRVSDDILNTFIVTASEPIYTIY